MVSASNRMLFWIGVIVGFLAGGLSCVDPLEYIISRTSVSDLDREEFKSGPEVIG